MYSIISKDRAWEIAREFSEIAKREDVDDSILGVYVIGSLGAGEYIPGRSDIDTALPDRFGVTDMIGRLHDEKNRMQTNHAR